MMRRSLMHSPTDHSDFPEKLMEKKRRGERIVMLTAYDAPFAELIEKSGAVDLILVGDSLGMVVQGRDSTRDVSIEQMRYHTEIVARATEHTVLVGDLPCHSFDTAEEALKNAKLLIEAGAWAVKFEGYHREAATALVEAGIPLMGHLGLLPQTAKSFSVRGKEEKEAEAILEDAKSLEDCGLFSIVLESIPRKLAKRVSEELTIPCIGIGAGPDCDGQVLVTYDMLGLTRGRIPRFVKGYANLGTTIEEAVRKYADDVRGGSFPSDSHSYH